MFPFAQPFRPKEAGLTQLSASGAALCRAVAKFNGLLRTGRNRKSLLANRASIGKPLGDYRTLPEEQS
jgi:hypothetical protein